MRKWMMVAGAALVCVGCGGKSGPPPPPTPMSVTIVAPGNVLFLGETYTFQMQLRMSDNSVVTTGGTWGSDAPGVATANSFNGQVEIVGIGAATIFVDVQGLRGTLLIRGTVNYAGTLDGRWRTTGCSQSGVWVEVRPCSEFPVGTVFGFEGSFTQNQLTVVATMDLIEFPADPVTVTINEAGELRFRSEHLHEEFDLRATVDWVFRPIGRTQIEGTVIARVRVVGLSGTWEIRGDILPRGILRLEAPAASEPGQSLLDALQRLRISRSS